MCAATAASCSATRVPSPRTCASLYRAYIYAAPTLVDLDHDGKLEIVIGTSVGFVYVLDHLGQPLPGWPRQMGQVAAQVATADVDADGYLELLAADTHGNVALFNRSGEVIWDMHVRSPVAQAPALGDIDGNGRLEAAFGTAAGEVYVVDALTGAAAMPLRQVHLMSGQHATRHACRL